MKAKINQLFGVQAPDAAVVDVRDVDIMLAESYPKPTDGYVFEPVLLKKLLRFFLGKPARRNLFLMGDAGTGKTSVVLEVAARLNVPVYAIACSGKTRFVHLVGSRELINGNTVWRDGPLVSAMKNGGTFLANEITRLDAGEQMNLAEVLDLRATLTIPDTGEIITAHDDFRVVVTGNSGGFGDDSGAYVGEKASSYAFIDRFQKMKVDYMPETQEVSLLMSVAPYLPEDVCLAMVRLANDVRKNFVGRGGSFQTIISTRSLVVWAKESEGYKAMGFDDPLSEALMDTILCGLPAEELAVIMELWSKWLNVNINQADVADVA